MPYFHLSVGQPLDQDTRDFLARSTTALIADRLGKRAAVTAVRIDSVPVTHWFVAGEPVASGLTPVQATLLITAGTNTAEEKAGFIADLDRLLKETFGPIPEASYLVLHEIGAGDWGYDGQTQADRRRTPA